MPPTPREVSVDNKVGLVVVVVVAVITACDDSDANDELLPPLLLLLYPPLPLLTPLSHGNDVSNMFPSTICVTNNRETPSGDTKKTNIGRFVNLVATAAAYVEGRAMNHGCTMTDVIYINDSEP